LLLSPEQVNAAMGAAGMTVTNTQTSMSDNSATMAPQECLAIDVSDTSVFVIRPDGYLGIAARGVVDTDELVRHLKATFR
jgi:hypothetical protein